jgi:outer membrane protein assembly factor BamA
MISSLTLKGANSSPTPVLKEGEGIQTGKGGPPNNTPTKVSRFEVADSSSLVLLKWEPLDPDAVPVDGYRIYRSIQPAGPVSVIGKTDGTKLCQFSDYDVSEGVTYDYYVSAFNTAGEGPKSQAVTATLYRTLTHRDYEFSFTPDIMLFLAGYDSSLGFVGGGLAQLSDYLGDHRLSLMGDTIPSVQTGLEINFEDSQWRTTVDADFYYFQNYFQVYDLQNNSIVNQYRNNENGFDIHFSYPLDFNTRIEYGIGSQRFQGSPLYLQFSEGISNYSMNSSQWDVANFYVLSFVKDERKATHFWASSGYGLNFTLLQALPVLDSNVQFANLLFETQAYADLGFLNHLIWANRLIAMSSQGPDPQTFFIGNDAPFQAYFTTLRGYGGTTFFGSNLALINSELRYPLAVDLNFPLQPLSFLLLKDIELAGFMDSGVTSNSIANLTSSTTLWSLGTGLRFYTAVYQRAILMFRFDVAWRLDGNYPPTFNFNLSPIF